MPIPLESGRTNVFYFDSIAMSLFESETCSMSGNAGSAALAGQLGVPDANIYNGPQSMLGVAMDSSGGATSRRVTCVATPVSIECRTITNLNTV